MSGAWPASTGAVHDTTACRLPLVAVGDVGAGGGPGVAVLDGADWSPVPMALIELTTTLYAVPFVRPVSVHEVVGAVVVQVAPPG